MKKSILSLLVVAAFVFSVTSCGGKKANENVAQEEAAVVAGNVPKSLLTEEVKTETVQFLKDLPDSDIPYRIATGEVKLGVGNLSFMLPVAKAAELATPSQKARAIGIYFADFNVLKALGQPFTDVENVLAKLTSDLNITFVLNILKEQVPPPTSKEEFAAALKVQEDRLIDELAVNNKVDVQIEILSGATAEFACVYANPSLVVQGDATSAGLSDNMQKRLQTLSQITSDLTVYYPDLKTLGETINPLQEKVTSIQTARNNSAAILGIRDALLK
ncbi:hypothetical protein AGMMS49574_10060 [Bacteroidia bacterium]|nr:hypothetical protein AGMMS49574_10060 [Bacteroidia bacterium]